jgi:hypothetical protein
MIIADIVLPYVTSALSRYERIAYGILSQSIARIRRSECIERYYIERFLSEHAQRIRGSVLEGKDAGYTRRFGRGMRPSRGQHRPGQPRRRPACGPERTGQRADRVLRLRDPDACHAVSLPRDGVANVWASPAPGGVLMLTAPSLARVDPHDPGTDFWRFTPNGLAELLHRLGMPASVAGYGNVLACVASLWGPSVEELSAEELDVADPRFSLVACAHAGKAR